MKSYVVTVTPNPALDMGGEVASLIPNEKSYVVHPSRHPGGNAINAGRILSRLKTPVICTGFLGGNTGEEIESLLTKEKVRNHFIPIAQATRMNITVSNQKDHNQTRLTFPGPVISRQEKENLIRYLKSQHKMSHLVIGGSFPEGFTVTDVIRLARLAKKLNVPTIIDCPGKLLRRLLPARPLLIKPNLIEFQQLVGKKVQSLPTVIREARKLLSQVSLVCVSSVEGGTLLVTRDGCFFGKIAPVKIRSTVGAGDSMVGSFVAQLHKGNVDSQDLLRWGLAASAATLATTGTTLGAASAIKKLYKKTRVKRLA
jgi:1-phosphofructokinase family hexose kinase